MKRSGISRVELIMILAALAIFALSLVPSYYNAVDAIAVERTARILDVLNRSFVRSDDFESDLESAVWPRAVQIETMTIDSTNGMTVVLSLRAGERRVSAKDSAGYK